MNPDSEIELTDAEWLRLIRSVDFPLAVDLVERVFVRPLAEQVRAE